MTAVCEAIPRKLLSRIVAVVFALLCLGGQSLAMEPSEAEKVVQDYGRVLEAVADSLIVASESRLPRPKEKIKEAILFVLPLTSGEMREYLRAGYMNLGMFQNLRRELEFLELPADAGLLTDAEIESLANEIADIPMRLDLQKFVISEMEILIEELEQKGF